MYIRFLFVPFVALSMAAPSEAGPFRRASKPDPTIHVPALIETLKLSKDEKARASAASELRDYDAKVYPDVLPTLVDALSNDPSSSVRSEAAESIGKVRPISLQAGYALEQAISHDKALTVRISARTAMLQYRILGYFAGSKADLTMVQSAEPPLASETASKPAAGTTILRPTPPPIPVSGPVMSPSPLKLPPNTESLAPKKSPQSDEPPLQDQPRGPTLTTRPMSPVPVITIPSPTRDAIGPIPPGPALPAPKSLPELNKPVTKPTTPDDEGPTLGPPPPKK